MYLGLWLIVSFARSLEVGEFSMTIGVVHAEESTGQLPSYKLLESPELFVGTTSH
jgi:hypothetical protein